MEFLIQVMYFLLKLLEYMKRLSTVFALLHDCNYVWCVFSHLFFHRLPQVHFDGGTFTQHMRLSYCPYYVGIEEERYIDTVY